MTAQRTRKFLRFLGYAAFFVVCFVVFLVIMFPYDRLNGYAEAHLQRALGMRVHIDSIRPTIFGGVYIQGMTLGPSLPARGAPAPASTTPLVFVDDAVVNVSYLGLLLGEVDGDFEANLAGGQAEGSVVRDASHMALKLKLNGLQAKQIPAVRQKVGLPVSGQLTLDLEFDLPVGQADKATGNLTLALRGGVIGDGQARLSLGSLMSSRSYARRSEPSSDEGTLIQPISLGPIALQTKITKGQFDIPRIESISDDVELSFEGRIKLAEPIGQTRIDTYLTVKLTETYAQQDETTETLVSLADVVGQPAKRTDGAFGFRISGSLLRGVTFRPAKSFVLPGAGRRGRDRPRGPGRRGGKAGNRRPPRPRPQGPEARPNINRPGATPGPSPATLGPRPQITPPGAPNNRHPSGMPRYPHLDRQQIDTANQQPPEQEVVEEIQEDVQQEQVHDEQLDNANTNVEQEQEQEQEEELE